MVIKFVFHQRLSAILAMTNMTNFMDVQRLQLAFKTSVQVIVIT